MIQIGLEDYDKITAVLRVRGKAKDALRRALAGECTRYRAALEAGLNQSTLVRLEQRISTAAVALGMDVKFQRMRGEK